MTPAVLETPAAPQAAEPERELENGETLLAGEFLRRYQLMARLKKAELIEGQVIMPSPVRALLHAAPDALIQGWLFHYRSKHPEVCNFTNPTLRIDAENVPQPDGVLIRRTESGGRSRIDAEGYLTGSPELVVEIAASSASIDLHGKLRAYRRNRIQEYIVWRTLDREVDWFTLQNDDYARLKASADGTIESRVFPGLRLPVAALLSGDCAGLIAALG